jgi:uncharacterized protein YaaN involved in tellurite resistance
MTDTTLTKPQVNLDIVLEEAESKGMMVPVGDVYDAADAAAKAEFTPTTELDENEIKAAMAEIDLENTNSITRFGFGVSQDATAVSQEMIEGVRNKDTGPVGDIMNDMMLELRGLDADDLKGGGFMSWLRSHASRVAKFGQKFETVQNQIEGMKGNLLKHQTTLMTSVASMDRLYAKTEEQFHNLEVYIVAGERMVEQLKTKDLPAMQKLVEKGKKGKDGTPAALMPQKLADLQARIDQLERKVHDLKLVRMVTLQAMPKIRLTQESDNNLIGKIDSIIVTTIPIWYQEMAIAIEQAKTQKAADAVSSVTDATNDMLMKGAEQFKQATLDARRAVEKSVVGIEAVEYQNQKIIETIEEALQITAEGKAAREEADRVLKGTEEALRKALATTTAE